MSTGNSVYSIYSKCPHSEVKKTTFLVAVSHCLCPKILGLLHVFSLHNNSTNGDDRVLFSNIPLKAFMVTQVAVDIKSDRISYVN